MALDRTQLLTACKRTVVPVEVPALGGTVYLKALSGAEVAAIYTALKDPAEITQAVVVLSLCDEAGARLLTLDDRAEFFDKPYGVFADLQGQALAINRLTKEASDGAGKG